MEQNKNTAAPAKDPLPTDPSNTRGIGQNVEQDVAKIKEGLNGQSAKLEDQEERDTDQVNEQANAENYIKHPSPED